MPICQLFEYQMADSDYNLSGLSGSTTQNMETPNKYSVDAKSFLKTKTTVFNRWLGFVLCERNINCTSFEKVLSSVKY